MITKTTHYFNQRYIFSEAINITLVIYALLLPFSNAFSTFTGPYILLFLWILEGNWQEKFNKIKSYKAIIFLILFVLFNTISLFWSNNINEGIHNLRYYFAVLLLFIIIFTSLQERYLNSSWCFPFFLWFVSCKLPLYGYIWFLGSYKGYFPQTLFFMLTVLYRPIFGLYYPFLIWAILDGILFHNCILEATL